MAEETERALEAAAHLAPSDAGTVAVLRTLAARIDAGQDPEAPFDNWTVPTYLKYAAELGLTALSRERLGLKEQKDGGKLAELRAIRGGKA